MQGTSLIVLVVVMFAAMYFLMIRPQKKQMDKQKEMLNKAQPGARVMLTSGIFGTIRAAGDKQFVIELAPGVDVTVVKQAVTKVVSPEEEEFEFADSEPDTDDGAETAAVDAPSEDKEPTTLAAPSPSPVPGSTSPAEPPAESVRDVPLDYSDSQPLAGAPDPDADDTTGRDSK